MSKHSILRQSKQSINHLLCYVDPDRLLGTLSKGEMCQNKIVWANSAEFGQNLYFKCQLFFFFFPLRLNFEGICKKKLESPTLSESGVSGISYFTEHKGLQKEAMRRWYQSEWKATTKQLWTEFPTLPVSFTCRCGICQFPMTSVCVLQYQDMRHDWLICSSDSVSWPNNSLLSNAEYEGSNKRKKKGEMRSPYSIFWIGR